MAQLRLLAVFERRSAIAAQSGRLWPYLDRGKTAEKKMCGSPHYAARSRPDPCRTLNQVGTAERCAAGLIK
jgi:hypothetical protein